MTVTVRDFPSYAHIVESRIRVRGQPQRNRSIFNRKGVAPHGLAEMWAGSILLAPMSVENYNLFLAWADSLDGMANAFALPMPAGVRQRDTGFGFSEVLSSSPSTNVPGSRRVAGLQISPGDPGNPTLGADTLRRGTLIALGTITQDDYQVVQVTADLPIATTEILAEIAPRLRTDLGTISAFTVGGDVSLRLRLATDKLPDAKRYVNGSGLVTLNVLEHTAP